jgi:cytochrome c oxidase assembly factor CtaG
MTLRDPSVRQFWEAVFGRVEGQRPQQPIDRAIVLATRMCLAAGVTLIFAVAVLAVKLVG